MSKQTSVLLVAASVIFLGSLVAASQPATDGWAVPPEAKAAKNPVKADAKSVEAGAALYKQNCAPCHGEAGLGDGPMGKMFKIAVKLNDGAYLSKQTDGELFYKISKGKTPMPAMEKKLSETDRWNIVNFVRSMAKKAK